MKRVLTVALCAVFGVSILGCRAEVDTDDHDGRDTHYKKTTTVDRDGDRTVKTEKRSSD
jgi:hypothetical protein